MWYSEYVVCGILCLCFCFILFPVRRFNVYTARAKCYTSIFSWSVLCYSYTSSKYTSTYFFKLSAPFYSISLLVVTQIRGHIAGSCPPYPLRFLPCILYPVKISALSPLDVWVAIISSNSGIYDTLPSSAKVSSIMSACCCSV